MVSRIRQWRENRRRRRQVLARVRQAFANLNFLIAENPDEIVLLYGLDLAASYLEIIHQATQAGTILEVHPLPTWMKGDEVRH